MTMKSLAQFYIYLPAELYQYQIQQTVLINLKKIKEFLIKKQKKTKQKNIKKIVDDDEKLCFQKLNLFYENEQFVREIKYFHNDINKYRVASTYYTEDKIGNKVNALYNVKGLSLGFDYLQVTLFCHQKRL